MIYCIEASTTPLNYILGDPRGGMFPIGTDVWLDNYYLNLVECSPSPTLIDNPNQNLYNGFNLFFIVFLGLTFLFLCHQKFRK